MDNYVYLLSQNFALYRGIKTTVLPISPTQIRDVVELLANSDVTLSEQNRLIFLESANLRDIIDEARVGDVSAKTFVESLIPLLQGRKVQQGKHGLVQLLEYYQSEYLQGHVNTPEYQLISDILRLPLVEITDQEYQQGQYQRGAVGQWIFTQEQIQIDTNGIRFINDSTIQGSYLRVNNPLDEKGLHSLVQKWLMHVHWYQWQSEFTAEKITRNLHFYRYPLMVGELQGYGEWSAIVGVPEESSDSCPVCKGEGLVDAPTPSNDQSTTIQSQPMAESQIKVTCSNCGGNGQIPTTIERQYSTNGVTEATTLQSLDLLDTVQLQWHIQETLDSIPSNQEFVIRSSMDSTDGKVLLPLIRDPHTVLEPVRRSNENTLLQLAQQTAGQQGQLRQIQFNRLDTISWILYPLLKPIYFGRVKNGEQVLEFQIDAELGEIAVVVPAGASIKPLEKLSLTYSKQTHISTLADKHPDVLERERTISRIGSIIVMILIIGFLVWFFNVFFVPILSSFL